MNKADLLKQFYFEQVQEDQNKASKNTLPIEEQILVNERLRRLVRELETEKLIEYHDSHFVLTNIGKYLARIL
ncbi:MAG: hypothetical protein ACOYVK_12810 [Bacillota bacterium]